MAVELKKLSGPGLKALVTELDKVTYTGIKNEFKGVRIRVKPSIDYRDDRWDVTMSRRTYRKLTKHRGIEATADEFR